MWPSLGIRRNSGKSIAILNGSSCVSPGINVSTSINNNFFMSNMNLVCGLDSRIVWWKFKLIEKECRLPQRLIWTLCDKVLRDDLNESSTVYFLTSDNKHAVCGTDFSPMQINFFAENISDDSSLWRRPPITCQARKKISFTDVHFGTST